MLFSISSQRVKYVVFGIILSLSIMFTSHGDPLEKADFRMLSHLLFIISAREYN